MDNRRTGKKKQGSRKIAVGWAIGGALLFGLLSYLYSNSLSDIYCSEAILRVIVQLPAAGQSPSSGSELAGQIPSVIWRDFLTDDRLKDLGTKENLYPGMKSEAASGDLVRQMKKDIVVESLGNGMVRISCQSQDPKLAASLGELVVSALVKGQNGDKARILESQIKETESKLQKLNKQISDLNLQVGGRPGEQKGASFANVRQIIQKLQANLDHIGRLEVEKANKERTLAERQREKNWAGSPQDTVSSELSGQIAGLNQQLEEARQEGDGLRSRIAQYQNRIDLLSQYEKQHKQLLDNYEAVRQQYQQLLASRIQLESPQAQDGQKGPRLQVVVPPSRPDRPSKPNRPLMNLLGILIGTAVGLGFSWLLKPRKRREPGPEDLIQVAGMPVLARIPVIDEEPVTTHSGERRIP
jgi:uncharacterized protein involved in exopolysaccharide biosynthesis